MYLIKRIAFFPENLPFTHSFLIFFFCTMVYIHLSKAIIEFLSQVKWKSLKYRETNY